MNRTFRSTHFGSFPKNRVMQRTLEIHLEYKKIMLEVWLLRTFYDDCPCGVQGSDSRQH